MNKQERKRFVERIYSEIVNFDDDATFVQLDERFFERIHLQFIQKKPYTAVMASYSLGTTFVPDVAFAKVCYPDKWNARYGRELVVRKVLGSIAKQL